MAGWLGRLFHRKKDEPLRCTAVVAAAGSSARMEGQDKLLLLLGEQPVLGPCPSGAGALPLYHGDRNRHTGRPDRTRWAAVQGLCLFQGEQGHRGGDTRTASVLAGVREAEEGASLIAVHDGAALW